ncbi:MAG TPA: hypothetical protein VMY39_05790 [Planctomycetota bacterium]|nr:hypothetical protein [Planctomycetota bacterium]
MMRRATCNLRSPLAHAGSALILTLAILALMAIMATSFVTLMRLDVRITRNYVDDQTCEMLAHGMLNYVKSLLREDLNRTWGRYENRETAVGFHSWTGWTESVGELTTRVPGFSEETIGTLSFNDRMGTPVSNDFWFSPPYGSWVGDPSAIYADGVHAIHQSTFRWESHYTYEQGRIGRYYDAASNREFDVWLGGSNNCRDARGYVVADSNPSPGKVPIDDGGDGIANPPYVPGSDPTADENFSITEFYYDTVPFVVYSQGPFYFPGTRITGETALFGNTFWRWGLNVGPTQSGYANLNAHGNVDGADAGYLQNMGNIGLVVRRAYDERRSQVPSEHLGRMEWQGFAGEYETSQTRTDALGVSYQGFPQRYNNVLYAPAAASLEKLFFRHAYAGQPTDVSVPHASVDRAKARQLIRWRWGRGTGIPVDGDPRWRVGWRRDGGSYCKFPSPENPMVQDRYFGANEVAEHDYSMDHPGTSAVAGILTDDEWRALRPHLNMWAVDTILRGKIWPTEGWLPWRPAGVPGDWRHLDILKRVNLNIIGASDPDANDYPHLAGEDRDLLRRWYAKRSRERDRLYYMLLGAMRFTDAPAGDDVRKRKACQLVASLADMVDRDHDETFYKAPDETVAEAVASGHWALGVEKFPVLNEIALYVSASGTVDWQPGRLRVELYNPAENIPWIPDADEAFDISEYVIRVGTYAYRVGDLAVYGAADLNTPIADAATTIGADGMYAYPQAAGVMTHPTWSRLVQVGWHSAAVGMEVPLGTTKTDYANPLEISLWKLLSTDADDGEPGVNVPVAGNRVADLTPVGHATRRYVCVDRTPAIRLVKPVASGGPGGTSNKYVGLYRRWDPMNPLVYGTEGTDEKSNVLWCAGWLMPQVATMSRPNVDYPGKVPSLFYPGEGTCPYKYERRFEMNFKVVDGDLPSVGWFGEVFLRNCAQDGPLTWVQEEPQEPGFTSAYPRCSKYKNLLETAKLDIFRPWDKPHNLSLFEMFTVRDPMNDGVDNDGDGAIDAEDTGRQPGDLWGPEVRVFGLVDINHVGVRVLATTIPDYRVPSLRTILSSYYGPQRERNHANWAGHDGGAMGPWESIGQILMWDDMIRNPGITMGHFTNWKYKTAPVYVSTVNLCGKTEEDHWGTGYCPGIDDDGDGIVDDRDERDFFFMHAANFLTTRSNTFTVEIVTQIVDAPKWPGKNHHRGYYQTDFVHSEKHLILLLDRSTTLRFNPDGSCDFTGPMRIHARRWGHERR